MAEKTELTKPVSDIDLIRGRELPAIEDAEQAQERIVEAILSADTLEELFEERGTTATKDFVGHPIIVRDCSLRRGELDGNEGTWMLIEAFHLEDGERVVLNTGSPNIMAILWRCKRMGALPVEVVVSETGRARPGQNRPLTLTPIGKTLAAIQQAKSKS